MSTGPLSFDAERLNAADRFIQSHYVDPQILPGLSWAVVHGNEIVHRSDVGYDEDAIFRIYSMTKPVTSIAALILMERGLLHLNDPVAQWLPSWENLRVHRAHSGPDSSTQGLDRPVTVQHLMTHTAGLTYAWMYANSVDAAYRERGIGDRSVPLDQMCERLAEVPLLFQPGDRWQYSVATDVLGHVIELVSGMTLDRFFQAEILEPLGMADTGFWVPEHSADRLVPNVAKPDSSPFGVPEGAPNLRDSELVIIDDGSDGTPFRARPPMLSGGGGLVSTLVDYTRFCRMVLNGGELDGARILGPRTLAFAARNHLPDNALLSDIGKSIATETRNDGMGFGLGFSVVENAAANGVIQSDGTLAWGGAASTLFWIDPAEDLAVVGMTQLMPSWSTSIRDDLRQLVYAAVL